MPKIFNLINSLCSAIDIIYHMKNACVNTNTCIKKIFINFVLTPKDKKLTCVSHNPSWYFLVTAAATEDLATNTAVMATSKCVELISAFIALLTITVRHPILLKVTIFIRLWCLKVRSYMIIL